MLQRVEVKWTIRIQETMQRQQNIKTYQSDLLGMKIRYQEPMDVMWNKCSHNFRKCSRNVILGVKMSVENGIEIDNKKEIRKYPWKMEGNKSTEL